MHYPRVDFQLGQVLPPVLQTLEVIRHHRLAGLDLHRLVGVGAGCRAKGVFPD